MLLPESMTQNVDVATELTSQIEFYPDYFLADKRKYAENHCRLRKKFT